jgi:hypothetical protein
MEILNLKAKTNNLNLKHYTKLNLKINLTLKTGPMEHHLLMKKYQNLVEKFK